MTPEEAAEYKRQERKRKEALGFKWRGLWVRPEAWDAIRRYADKANRKAAREAAKAEKGD